MSRFDEWMVTKKGITHFVESADSDEEFSDLDGKNLCPLCVSTGGMAVGDCVFHDEGYRCPTTDNMICRHCYDSGLDLRDVDEDDRNRAFELAKFFDDEVQRVYFGM